MEDCGALELVGEGSTRKVYAVGDGLVMKVAKNEAGVAQNKAELVNFMYGLACFPKLDSYESDYEAVVVQRVVPCNGIEGAEDMIAEVFGAEGKRFLERLSRMLVWMSEMDLHARDAKKIAADCTIDPLWRKLACKIAKPRNAAQRALAELAEYASWRRQEFSPCDLDDVRNWGLVQTEDGVVPVVLDAGYTPSLSRR